MTTLNMTTGARTSLVVLYSHAELGGWDTWALPQIFRLFKYPKKSLLKSSHPKSTCEIFLPKKIPESKLSNPKNSFDHLRHLKSGVTPWVRKQTESLCDYLVSILFDN